MLYIARTRSKIKGKRKRKEHAKKRKNCRKNPLDFSLCWDIMDNDKDTKVKEEMKLAEVTEEEKMRIQAMIDGLVERAKKASDEYQKLDQETVDRIVKAMSMAGLEHHMELAKMAVEETRKRNLRR